MCLLIEEIRINPDQSVSTVFQQRCERKEVINLINYLPFITQFRKIVDIKLRHYIHIKLGMISCIMSWILFIILREGVETVIIEKQMLLFTQLCKAVHANNILETNETTTKTAPSTTTTTTALPSTTRPTLVEFTPPVKKRLLRSRRSHNLIQLKAECCQGDLCNAFNLHDPNRKNIFLLSYLLLLQ